MNILNLGAGVQSTTLYLMFLRGEITPQIDYAIFADTGIEPRPVYEHIEWMKSLSGPEIRVVSQGNLGDDLSRGVNSTGQRFATVPAYLKKPDTSKRGQQRRQCSFEYKVRPIDRDIRALLGIQPRKRWPKGLRITQCYGFSFDEGGRAARLQRRFREEKPYVDLRFPLIENMMTRADCISYLQDKVPHQTPRSACTICPYRRDPEWAWLQQNDPAGWEYAVRMDKRIREPGVICNRRLQSQMYLHDSLVPLGEVKLDLRPKPRDLQLSMSFAVECEGVCGV